MDRDTARLSGRSYDVLIVGGGIHGAAAAREAALRGLSVALVDQGDFCSGTSANSLKIIHGGLRYLQQANVTRLRQSARERMVMMRIAPHLVHPLPCLMPTLPALMKSRLALAAGLLANDIFSAPFNRSPDPEKVLPRGRTIGPAEWARRVPGLAMPSDTGAAEWYDAIAWNTERLVVGMVRAAVAAGARAANYVEVTGFRRQGERVVGVTARDALSGRDLDIEARITINNTGPWLGRVLALPGGYPVPPALAAEPVLAMNVILRRPLSDRWAVGLPASRVHPGDSRLFFFVPWRGRTLAGTSYRICRDAPGRLAVGEADVAGLVASLASVWPSAGIEMADVSRIHAGVLPGSSRPDGREPSVWGRYAILDHARQGGPEGLISVLGVKYTTARDVAVRTLDGAAAKLGRPTGGGESDRLPLPGGDIPDFRAFLAEAIGARPADMPEAAMVRLAGNYGTEWRRIMEIVKEDPALGRPVGEGTETIGAEAVFAAREEMAETLSDAALRRTDLASSAAPGEAALATFAAIMAREKGWDRARQAAEVEDVRRALRVPGVIG